MPTSDIYISDEVREVRRLHEDLLTDEFLRLPIHEQIHRQARRIVDAHTSGNRTVATHVTCWHPKLTGHSIDDIMNHNLTLQDAQETIAREYGFQGWSDALKYGNEPSDQTFESAVDAILNGDTARLKKLLAQRPSLVRERSGYGHRSTLLHYVGSNGVETYRQVVPFNLAEVAQILLDAGADVNATAEMYGGGSTTIELLTTSCHPANAGVMEDVVTVLVDGGAES